MKRGDMRRQRCRSVGWLLVGVAVLGACESGNGDSAPQPVREVRADDTLLLAAARVALPPPADPARDLPEPDSEGARYLQRYCSTCHELPTPGTHSPTDWPQVARRMWLRIDGLPARYDVPRPTEGQRAVILRYLVQHGLRTSGAALPPGEGRTEFIAHCGRCHALPDLAAHAPEDWPRVLERMTALTERMLGAVPAPEEQRRVEQYLTTVSALLGP